MVSCILALYLALPGAMALGDHVVRLKPDTTTVHGDGGHGVRLKPDTTTVHGGGGHGAGTRGVRLQPDLTADALYARREDLASAKQAAAIWAERLQQNQKDFEAAWKLARARYWLGGHGPEPERKASLQAGIQAGRAAVAAEPNRPHGHFWIAANMGALAESFGLRQGLKYRGDIKNELLTVLKLDPAFQQGSADRALGRWYYKVPGLFGGSKKQSEQHLRASLEYGPNNTASRFFLAETLRALDRPQEARAELQKVLDAPIDPDWGPEDRDFKERARRLLATPR